MVPMQISTCLQIYIGVQHVRLRTITELLLYRKSKQIFSRKEKIKPTLCGPKRHFNNSAIFIPTKVNPNPIKKDYMTKHRAFLMQQQHKEYYQKAHSALAGAVWDDELK